MFEIQKSEALVKLQEATNRNDPLIDTTKAIQEYADALSPIMESVLTEGVKSGSELARPRNPHKDLIPFLLSDWAIAWLKTRMKWVATEISETSSTLVETPRKKQRTLYNRR